MCGTNTAKNLNHKCVVACKQTASPIVNSEVVYSVECVLSTHIATFSTMPPAQVNSEVEYSIECVSTHITTFTTMLLARVNSDIVCSVECVSTQVATFSTVLLARVLQDYQTASMLCVLFHVNFEVAWVTERLSTKVTKAKFFLHFTLICFYTRH